MLSLLIFNVKVVIYLFQDFQNWENLTPLKRPIQGKKYLDQVLNISFSGIPFKKIKIKKKFNQGMINFFLEKF